MSYIFGKKQSPPLLNGAITHAQSDRYQPTVPTFRAAYYKDQWTFDVELDGLLTQGISSLAVAMMPSDYGLVRFREVRDAHRWPGLRQRRMVVRASGGFGGEYRPRRLSGALVREARPDAVRDAPAIIEFT
jgi:hypothetical protein